MIDLQDLREAIRSNVLVRRRPGTRIISSNERDQDEWIFDFRALLLQPEWLNRYAELFWESCAGQYPFQVCGMESAAISLVSAIVMKGIERGTPVNGLYIRKSRKRYGLLKQIEGAPNSEKVILVDDLINSGGTFHKQIKILADAGLRVTSAFALIKYRNDEAYRALGIPIATVCTLKDFGLPEYTASRNNNKYDAFTVQWRFCAQNPSYNVVNPKSSPALYDGKAYFGTDAGALVCLEQSTGNALWQFDTGKDAWDRGILSSPVVENGRVYFGAYDGNVYALDATTGARVWTYEEADWVGSSPCVARDLNLLFIGLEFGLIRKQGGIAALDLKTGKRVWADRSAEYTHCSPLYIQEENLVVIGGNDCSVSAYQADTGHLCWRYQTRGQVKASFSYDSARRLVLFGSMDGTFYALSARDGVPIFGKETGAGIYSTPHIQDNMVFFSSLDKHIYALDMDSWRERWNFATKGRIFASPVILDGSLWCGSNDGKLYELDPEKGNLRGFFQASERIVNKIAYNPATKRFFVPTQANELYCLARTKG